MIDIIHFYVTLHQKSDENKFKFRYAKNIHDSKGKIIIAKNLKL